MFVLDRFRVRHVVHRVGNDGAALVVGNVKDLKADVDCAVRELPKTKAVKLIELARKNHPLSERIKRLLFLNVVEPKLQFGSLEQAGEERCISPYRDPLVSVIVVIVIEVRPNWEALVGGDRHLTEGPHPVFLSVPTVEEVCNLRPDMFQ